MTWAYTSLAVLAGAMLPLQAAINARLAKVIGSSVWAAAYSGAALAVLLTIVAGLFFRSMPRTEGLSSLPWWAWTGGVCGAVVLSATTATAPRLGAAAMVAFVMTGQVAGSLVLDHFGLFGLDVQIITLKRLAAAVLLIAGALLIR